MLVFGASGDLTKRLLVPALYNLACDGLLSENFALLGTAMDPLTTEPFRARMSEDIKKFHTRKEFDPAQVGRAASAASTTCPAAFNDLGAFAEAQGEGRRAGRAARRRAATSSSTSPCAPQFFGLLCDNLHQSGFKEGAGWKRIIVEKPFGTDLESALQLNKEVLAHWHEEPDLPRRPLPRQGDRPEPAGVPLLQRDVRAALEQELHRQHPVQRRRGRRCRGARRLLRLVRRAARHDAEPHVPDARVSLHGGARLVRARRDPQREGQAARSRCAPTRPRRSRGTSSAGSTARSSTTAGKVAKPGYRQEKDVDPRVARPRRTPPRGCTSTTGAGRACRSTCARARRCGSAGPRSSSSSRRRREVIFRGTPVQSLARQPADLSHPALPGHRDPVPGQDPGADGCSSSRSTCASRTATRSRRRATRATR